MAVPSTWPRDIAAAGGAYWPLTVFNDEPFSRTITYKNVDLTSAAFEGGVRAAFEESSAVLQTFTFSDQLLGADTILTISISEVGIEALRNGADAGAIEQLFYTIKCTPSGGSKSTHFAGEFNLQGL